MFGAPIKSVDESAYSRSHCLSHLTSPLLALPDLSLLSLPAPSPPSLTLSFHLNVFLSVFFLEKYISGFLFENKWEVGTKNCNWVNQYI